MQEALKVLEFTEEEIRDMFKLLSGVLQLGNLEFMTAGGAQITTKQGQDDVCVKRVMEWFGGIEELDVFPCDSSGQ